MNLQPVTFDAGRPGLMALDVAPLRELLERIVARWNPAEIWVFGSRARGTAKPQSDWDLLVVVPDDVDEREVDDPLIGWRLQKGSGVHADVIACRVSEFREARTTPNTLAYEAATAGVQIYER